MKLFHFAEIRRLSSGGFASTDRHVFPVPSAYPGAAVVYVTHIVGRDPAIAFPVLEESAPEELL